MSSRHKPNTTSRQVVITDALVNSTRRRSSKRLTRPREARLHGSHGQSQRKRDLFITEAFHLAQHDRRPLVERQVLKRRLQARPKLFSRQFAIGAAGFGAQYHLAVFADVV